MQVNKLTGEVTETIGAAEFKLHATIARMAELERISGEKSIGDIVERLTGGSARVTLAAFDALCTSGNVEMFRNSLVGVSLKTGAVAAITAIAEGMPIPVSSEKNGEAAPI